MAATHTKIGSTQEEAENLQMEHKKFETTAAVRINQQSLFVTILIFLKNKFNVTTNILLIEIW